MLPDGLRLSIPELVLLAVQKLVNWAAPTQPKPSGLSGPTHHREGVRKKAFAFACLFTLANKEYDILLCDMWRLRIDRWDGSERDRSGLCRHGSQA